MKNSALIGATGEVLSSVPRIKGIKPTGSQVLVEVLTKQEQSGSKMIMPEKTSLRDCPQGYVLAVGPGFKNEWGFGIGDRVMISGTYTPTPNYDDNKRERVLLEPHSVKGVLVEE